jgi:hypothetical protein
MLLLDFANTALPCEQHDITGLLLRFAVNAPEKTTPS